MILRVIIPVYNEEKTIIQILEKIKKNSPNLFKYEVLVIEDGSTDQTRKLLESNKNLYDKLILNDSNKGKGYSVKEVISASKKFFNKKIKIENAPRRAGDAEILVSDISKLTENINWVPKLNKLEYLIKTSIDWEFKIKNAKII